MCVNGTNVACSVKMLFGLFDSFAVRSRRLGGDTAGRASAVDK